MILSLRNASLADAELLWHWRNEPVTRMNSLHSDPIPYEGHVAWLTRTLRDAGVAVYIACNDNNDPVGTIRFARTPADLLEISLSVDADFRGCGLGARMLCLGLERASAHFNAFGFCALVKKSNESSRRMFLGCGFSLIPEKEDESRDYFHLDYCPPTVREADQ